MWYENLFSPETIQTITYYIKHDWQHVKNFIKHPVTQIISHTASITHEAQPNDQPVSQLPPIVQITSVVLGPTVVNAIVNYVYQNRTIIFNAETYISVAKRIRDFILQSPVVQMVILATFVPSEEHSNRNSVQAYAAVLAPIVINLLSNYIYRNRETIFNPETYISIATRTWNYIKQNQVVRTLTYSVTRSNSYAVNPILRASIHVCLINEMFNYFFITNYQY